MESKNVGPEINAVGKRFSEEITKVQKRMFEIEEVKDNEIGYFFEDTRKLVRSICANAIRDLETISDMLTTRRDSIVVREIVNSLIDIRKRVNAPFSFRDLRRTVDEMHSIAWHTINFKPEQQGEDDA